MPKKEKIETQMSEKEHFSWKRLLITLLIVLITAGVTFAVTWCVLDKSVKESNEASEQLRVKLQGEVDELRLKLKTVDANNDLVYTNSDYGFSLTFPESWGEYKSYPVKTTGSTATWYFELPTDNSLWNTSMNTTAEKGYASIFAISAYTASEWLSNQSEAIKSTYLGKRGNYTFGYSRAQSAPDDLSDKFSDIKSIIETFDVN